MQDKIDLALKLVRDAPELAYDVETNGLDWKTCHVCGYSFSNGWEAIYIPVRHAGGANIYNVSDFEKSLAKAFRERTKPVIGHNIKFDMHFSVNHGVDLGNNVIDTLNTQALINESERSYSLGALARKYGLTPKREEDLYRHLSRMFGCAPNRKSMAYFHRLPGDDKLAHEYAAGDTLTTFELAQMQRKEIEEQGLERVFDMENQLLRPLFVMERYGLKVDESRIEQTIVQIQEHIEAIQTEYPEQSSVNVRSRTDLEDYFRANGITDWPFTEAGNPSFAKDWLKTTDRGSAIALEKRLRHFYNNFMYPLAFQHLHEGHLYTNFNPVKTDDYGTVSGRLSSNTPNMQQVPKRDKFIGRMFRQLFVAREGYFLAEIDYSQCEPRLYTHYSNEPRLVEGYKSDPAIDMHQIVSEMMSVGRDEAKTINLGILYMMGIAKLAESLAISYTEAEQLMHKWYKLFPRVRQFRKRASRVAETRGYVHTILGRRRRFPDPRFAYKAANSIIQGGSADILKYKIVEIYAYITSLPEGTVRMLLNIHDALLFEVLDNVEGKEALIEIERIMNNVQCDPFNLKVPFTTDIAIGYDWGEATYGKA